MTLIQKIITIYPQLANYDFVSGAIRLQNDGDGKGDYIAAWAHPTLTQPTAAQLAALP